jgi:hypothetical protein
MVRPTSRVSEFRGLRSSPHLVIKVTIGKAGLQDLELLEMKVKLLSAEFISDNKMKSNLCLAKVNATPRLGTA